MQSLAVNQPVEKEIQLMIPELDPLRKTMTPEQLKTLNLLRAARMRGLTGPELLENVWNYKARIHELIHKFGAVIESARVPGKRFKRYVLKGMKTCQQIRDENRKVWVRGGRFEMLVPASEVRHDNKDV